MRVVVIEDSDITRDLIVELCEEAGDLRVVATAQTGEAGYEAVFKLRPDLAIVDIGLPDIDGFEVVSRIMARCPTPIVVLTAALRPKGRLDAFHALSLGALHVMEKPAASDLFEPAWRQHLRRDLQVLAKVPVIAHVSRRRALPSTLPKPPEVTTPARIDVVTIVGSVGGANATHDLLAALPPLDVPIVIALHIGKGLAPSLARYLGVAASVPVEVLEPGVTELSRGHIYVAPGGYQVEMVGRARARVGAPIQGALYAPSLDHFFLSVARTYRETAVGVILTGMGADGARGLLAMRKEGAFTLGQDNATCVVYGMPREARALGAVLAEMPPAELAGVIADRVRESIIPDRVL
jgi:two-component system chemotaxis response regulator CheB